MKRRSSGSVRALLAMALAALVMIGIPGEAWSAAVALACREPDARPRGERDVERALRARDDVWGNALLRARDGPTYDGARRYLTPLFVARGPNGRPLIASGAHYLAFTYPSGPEGSGSAALHIADGSQIVSRGVGGSSLTVRVGAGGRERYGSCGARRSGPRLASGYLPILQTRYVDSAGVRYAQESFAGRVPGETSLTSFVALVADAHFARGDVRIGFVPDEGRALRYGLPSRMLLTTYVAWSIAEPARLREVDRASYEAARGNVVRYWRARLEEGAEIQVPEPRVHDAVQALLVQNLGLGWRYSLGNQYQQFSYPEALDVAQVLAASGFEATSAAILRRSLSTPDAPYRNWRLGQKLVATALHHRLFRDDELVAAMTPDLRRGVLDLRGQLASSPHGLLERERYSSDIPDLVHGLHSQAVVWQGLLAMGRVWARAGHPSVARTALSLAARLEIALRSAVRGSQRSLPDGSLFVPVRLLDGERPYGSITESRAGSYWNLVAPYAFASGLFAPGSPEAEGILRYLLRHGSRLLGLVRAGAYSLYGRNAVAPIGGVNPVYGLNVARVLADDDRPDQLVLTLYGQLAAGMTPGTFVAGEAVSVAPLRGERHRSTYLPPNAASNASFLETLRLMLVHETRDHDGAPRGLELAFATPRAWLAPGKRIAVRGLETSFGRLSFTITSSVGRVRATLERAGGSSAPRSLRLRLRLPRGDRIRHVTLDGRRLSLLDRETIGLPRRGGTLVVIARVSRVGDRPSD